MNKLEQTARIGEVTDAYKIVVAKTGIKKLLGRPTHG
jgi:hypothetical protein